MNLIFICTELKRLYNVVINELLYDSDLEKMTKNNDYHDIAWLLSNSDSFQSDDSLSSDDVYTEMFHRKNEIQSVVFKRSSVCFIIIDDSDSCYGIYYPGTLDRDINCCMDVGVFSLTKGIEIKTTKYSTINVFGYVSFSEKDYLLEMGARNWLLRVYDDRIVFNENQKVLKNYNKTLMKTAGIKQLLVFDCK